MTFDEWLEQNSEYIAQADDIERILERAWNAAWKARQEKDAEIAEGYVSPHGISRDCDPMAQNIVSKIREQE